MSSLKGPSTAPASHDGTPLRIAIVHARWNLPIINPLLEGTKKSLLASGVKPENIVVQSVPGSWELPIAVQRLYSASQIQSTSTSSGGLSAGDLLSSSTTDLTLSASSPKTTASTAPFDAIIAIGVLIKGETKHFEYIAESVSHGLMRVQLDAGVPLIFGLLTVLTEEQGLVRAGINPEGKGGDDGDKKSYKAHNHGEDWGLAAVELGVRRREWAEGKIVG